MDFAFTSALVELEAVKTTVVVLLDLVGMESEGQVVRRAVLNPDNGFACLFRATTSAEVSVRVNMGLKRQRSGSSALEALVLLRAAAVATLQGHDPGWMLAIRDRVRALGDRERRERNVDQGGTTRARDGLLPDGQG